MRKADIAAVLGFRLAQPDEKVWGESSMLAQQIAEHGPHTYWVGLDGPKDFDWIWLRDALTDQEFVNAMMFDPLHPKPLPEQLKPVIHAWPPTLDGVPLRSDLGLTVQAPANSRQTTPGRVTWTIRGAA